MKNVRIIAAAFLCFLALFVVGSGEAVMYKYVDKDKKEWFVDRPESIPEEYREDARIIDKELEKTGLVILKPQRSFLDTITIRAEHFIGSGLFRVVGIAIVIVFVLVVIAKTRGVISGRKAGFVILACIASLVFLFVFQSHIKRAVALLYDLKKEALDSKNKIEERSRKRDGAVKGLFGNTPPVERKRGPE